MHYLRRAGHDGGCAVADVDNGVGAKRLRLVNHALYGDLSRFVEHLRISHKLSSHECLHSGHKVTAYILRVHNGSLHNSQRLDLFSRDVVNI